ncbi:MAG: hypothetical protein V4655_12690 [Bdellovibrionota bacterium]
MKTHGILFFALWSLLTACGSETKTSEGPQFVTPPLPFSRTLTTLPLTDGPLAEHLIFARDVPGAQVDTLKSDLRIIDNWDGLMSATQQTTLEELLGDGVSTPESLSLWFKERIRYILRADLATYQLGLVYGKEGQVGLQELGPGENAEEEVNTGGGNIGTAIYLTTLDEQRVRGTLSYIVVLINDQWIPVLSPRAGLMRIGPALFDPNYQVNHTNVRAYSNSLQRIEVLFHEARHSDGNSSGGSTGFPHVVCPSGSLVPPELIGVPACDNTANGAYSVGAAVLDPLIDLCLRNARCSDAELKGLEAIRLDRLSRVIRSTATLKKLDPSPETGFNALNISDFRAFNLR